MVKVLHPSYRLYFIAAIIFHITLLMFLVIQSHTHKPTQVVRVVTTDKIVKSNLIAASDINKTIKEVKRREKLRKQRLLDEDKKLKATVKAKKQLQQHLAELKKNAAIKSKSLQKERERVKRLRKQAALLKQKKLREAQLLAKEKAREKQRIKALKKEAARIAANKRKMEQELKRKREAKALEAKRLAKVKRDAEKRLAKAKREQEERVRLKAQQEIEARVKHAKMLQEIDRYKAMITASIARQWLIGDQVNPDLSGVLLIRVAANGTVLDVQLVKSSGHAALDRSARLAVYKASPLAVPANPDLFNHFRTLRLTFTPRGVLG